MSCRVVGVGRGQEEGEVEKGRGKSEGVPTVMATVQQVKPLRAVGISAVLDLCICL